jgi:hypothetical protein
MFGLKMGELLIIALTFGALVLPVLFLRAWAKTLRLTRFHQTTAPGLVWLMLIPLFNLGWQFYLLRSVSRGIKGRLAELGRDAGDGGFGIGVAYQSLISLATLLNLGEGQGNGALSVLVGVLSLAGFVTWIVYWSRISRFNREMEASAAALQPPALAA